jgi:hypothetical protein
MSSSDEWSEWGYSILEPDLLTRIRGILEGQPIIVEHRLYRGSSAPLRLVFDNYEDFMDHLKSRARPGDHVLVWGFSDLCRDDSILAAGKHPDAMGRTPRFGAY